MEKNLPVVFIKRLSESEVKAALHDTSAKSVPPSEDPLLLDQSQIKVEDIELIEDASNVFIRQEASIVQEDIKIEDLEEGSVSVSSRLQDPDLSIKEEDINDTVDNVGNKTVPLSPSPTKSPGGQDSENCLSPQRLFFIKAVVPQKSYSSVLPRKIKKGTFRTKVSPKSVKKIVIKPDNIPEGFLKCGDCGFLVSKYQSFKNCRKCGAKIPNEAESMLKIPKLKNKNVKLNSTSPEKKISQNSNEISPSTSLGGSSSKNSDSVLGSNNLKDLDISVNLTDTLENDGTGNTINNIQTFSENLDQSSAGKSLSPTLEKNYDNDLSKQIISQNYLNPLDNSLLSQNILETVEVLENAGNLMDISEIQETSINQTKPNIKNNAKNFKNEDLKTSNNSLEPNKFFEVATGGGRLSLTGTSNNAEKSNLNVNLSESNDININEKETMNNSDLNLAKSDVSVSKSLQKRNSLSQSTGLDERKTISSTKINKIDLNISTTDNEKSCDISETKKKNVKWLNDTKTNEIDLNILTMDNEKTCDIPKIKKKNDKKDLTPKISVYDTKKQNSKANLDIDQRNVNDTTKSTTNEDSSNFMNTYLQYIKDTKPPKRLNVDKVSNKKVLVITLTSLPEDIVLKHLNKNVRAQKSFQVTEIVQDTKSKQLSKHLLKDRFKTAKNKLQKINGSSPKLARKNSKPQKTSLHKIKAGRVKKIKDFRSLHGILGCNKKTTTQKVTKDLVSKGKSEKLSKIPEKIKKDINKSMSRTRSTTVPKIHILKSKLQVKNKQLLNKSKLVKNNYRALHEKKIKDKSYLIEGVNMQKNVEFNETFMQNKRAISNTKGNKTAEEKPTKKNEMLNDSPVKAKGKANVNKSSLLKTNENESIPIKLKKNNPDKANIYNNGNLKSTRNLQLKVELKKLDILTKKLRSTGVDNFLTLNDKTKITNSKSIKHEVKTSELTDKNQDLRFKGLLKTKTSSQKLSRTIIEKSLRNKFINQKTSKNKTVQLPVLSKPIDRDTNQKLTVWDNKIQDRILKHPKPHKQKSKKQCYYCQYTAENKKSLIKHILKECEHFSHSELIKCQQCDSANHMNQTCENCASKCDFKECNFSTWFKKVMRHHKESGIHNFKCKKCHLKTSNSMEFKNHACCKTIKNLNGTLFQRKQDNIFSSKSINNRKNDLKHNMDSPLSKSGSYEEKSDFEDTNYSLEEASDTEEIQISTNIIKSMENPKTRDSICNIVEQSSSSVMSQNTNVKSSVTKQRFLSDKNYGEEEFLTKQNTSENIYLLEDKQNNIVYILDKNQNSELEEKNTKDYALSDKLMTIKKANTDIHNIEHTKTITSEDHSGTNDCSYETTETPKERRSCRNCGFVSRKLKVLTLCRKCNFRHEDRMVSKEIESSILTKSLEACSQCDYVSKKVKVLKNCPKCNFRHMDRIGFAYETKSRRKNQNYVESEAEENSIKNLEKGENRIEIAYEPKSQQTNKSHVNSEAEENSINCIQNLENGDNNIEIIFEDENIEIQNLDLENDVLLKTLEDINTI